MSTVDRRALVVGALVAALLALPAALIGDAVVEEGDDGNVVFLLLVPVLLGFALGGFAAARLRPEAPLVNGGLAALAAWAVIQAAGAIRRVVADEPIELQSWAFAALLAYSSGVLGAIVADRLARRRT